MMTIDKNDPGNMFAAIYHFPDHMKEALDIGQSIVLKRDYSPVNNVVIAGMGGSAIGGDVIRGLMERHLKCPIVVSRHYELPSWVNENTLVICSSYSGNTEETLSAFTDALEKNAQICGVTTGGKLGGVLTEHGLDKVTIPAGLQPRAALAYSFIPTLFLLDTFELFDKPFLSNLQETIDFLSRVRGEFSLASEENSIFTMARNMYQTLPVIYAQTNSLAVVANRLKGQLAENSKMLAFYNELPELNHNEIVGWENNTAILKKISLIWLQDEADHEHVTLRQMITEEVLTGLPENQYHLSGTATTYFTRFLELIHLSDWLSYWCAVLHGTDPTPVHKISMLKERLAQEN